MSKTHDPTITLHIRTVTGATFSVDVNPGFMTVAKLKEQCQAHSPLSAQDMQLVYAGRVLNNSLLLSAYRVQDGDTVRLVRLASNQLHSSKQPAPNNVSARSLKAATASESDPTGQADPFRELLGSYFKSSVFSDPEFMRALIKANPGMKAAMSHNPDMAHMVEDPEFISQMIQINQNPKLMQEMLRNNDRAMANLEMMPGGFKHLQQMYRATQSAHDAETGGPRNPSTDELNRRFARMLNVTIPSKDRVNTSPLPNPWARRSQARLNPYAMLPPGVLPRPSSSSASLTSSSPSLPPLGAADSSVSSRPSLGGARHPRPSRLNSDTGANADAHDAATPQAFDGMDLLQQLIFNAGQSNDADASRLTTRPLDALYDNNGSRGSLLPDPMSVTTWPPSSSTTDTDPHSAAASSSVHDNSFQSHQHSHPALSSLLSMTPINAANHDGDPMAAPFGHDLLDRSSNANQSSATVSPFMAEPEQRYQHELEILQSMGFSDQRLNIRALLAAGGDVNSAIEWLLQNSVN
ncbi:hypothetical protein H4R34_001298 [Dimargaris verticillata]|uniref:Ubiquilin n=1 Tax=Dimargaris verticillata TaxID=2761393 RepID=A0A9W8BAA5_9FUNG|nr:hypothetical protein H4R34_001298 [Dimargaris verticillata]